jgi:hypothetical protein
MYIFYSSIANSFAKQNRPHWGLLRIYLFWRLLAHQFLQPLQGKGNGQAGDDPVAGDFNAQYIVDFLQTVLDGVGMNAHELCCFAAVHAGVQHEGFQGFQKLLAFVFPRIPERFQQIHIVLFDVATLKLDVDAVAYQGHFVLGENPFEGEYHLNKGPGLVDQPISVGGAFDAVDAGDMENPYLLVIF